jgi:SAM-dependent methyltransferase
MGISGMKPRIGGVNLGDLARTTPVSDIFGWDRGLPVDRRYIEAFLASHASDVRGVVLEVADPRYTEQFGGERVERSDVLHPAEGNPRATLVANLETGDGLPSETYDCLIVTQTFQYLFDVPRALGNARRALKPGGVFLATFPGITQASTSDRDRWGEYWRFTSSAIRRLLETAFGGEVEVRAYGNVLASIAFLEGLAVEDLDAAALDEHDPAYELLIAARAVREGGG